jgi:hypothetical protein
VRLPGSDRRGDGDGPDRGGPDRDGLDRDDRSRRRDFWLHVALFVAVNALYLVWAWPLWLWVTAIWSVGLGVHASLAFGPPVARVPRRVPPGDRRP